MSQTTLDDKDPTKARKASGEYVHPEFENLTPDELKRAAAGFDVDAALIGLSLHEPFYGHIIRHFSKVETAAIPTAGVAVSNDAFMLYWNPLFLGAYSSRVQQGIMKHEALHLAFQHCTTRKYEPHWVWNMATDLAINGSLSHDELPHIGLFPGRKPLKEPVEPRAKAIAELIATLPVGLASEEYYSKLMSSPDVQEAIKESEEFQKALAEALGKMDDHGEWGDGDEQDGKVQADVRRILKEAVERADATNSWGSVSASMRGDLRRIAHGEIDWRSLLRQFVGNAWRSDRTTTIRRINKKHPGMMPGAHRDSRPKIAVFIDQSGSVGDGDLELFFSELAHLSARTDFWVYHFDTDVDDKSGTLWRRGSRVAPTRTRMGGTDFDAPTKWIADKKNFNGGSPWDGYIIMTDGGAPKPQRSRTKRAWVLCPGTELYFGAPPDSREPVIRMKRGLKQ